MGPVDGELRADGVAVMASDWRRCRRTAGDLAARRTAGSWEEKEHGGAVYRSRASSTIKLKRPEERGQPCHRGVGEDVEKLREAPSVHRPPLAQI